MEDWKEEEKSLKVMVAFMKALSNKVKLMVWEHIIVLMGQHIKDSGLIIYSTVTESLNTLIWGNILAILKKVSVMGVVHICIRDALTKDILSRTECREMAVLWVTMAKSILVNG